MAEMKDGGEKYEVVFYPVGRRKYIVEAHSYQDAEQKARKRWESDSQSFEPRLDDIKEVLK